MQDCREINTFAQAGLLGAKHMKGIRSQDFKLRRGYFCSQNWLKQK